MAKRPPHQQAELVIITGMSGSGKGSVIRALEDLGYYSVDNLPIELIPKFAELTRDSATVRCAALVVDVREGDSLKAFPALYARIRRSIPTKASVPRGERLDARAPLQRDTTSSSAGHESLGPA